MKEEMIKYFKALSDLNRLEIVELLIKGETCGCTLIDKLPITQPTLSYHLKHITQSGLATARKEGNWVKHYIDRSKIDDMIKFLENLKNASEDSCKL